MASYLEIVENPIAVRAHVRAQPIVRRDNTVWQLSIDRAMRMREMIEDGGYDPAQIMRVTGEADRILQVKIVPMSRNNRIEIVVLRGDI